MEPEVVEGKSLAKVRWPGVSTVTLGEKGAAGPEVGAGPVVTTIPLLRMSASWVRGEFLSVVGAGDTSSRKPIRGYRVPELFRMHQYLPESWRLRAVMVILTTLARASSCNR